MPNQDLSFDSGYNYMEISEGTEESKWPLEISIRDEEEDHFQSYCMNENELLALFNLLYRILKRDYSKKLEELQQLVLHGDSTEDIR